MDQKENDFYTPAETVVYLREVRGLLFTVDGLRGRRNRGKLRANAHRVLANNTLWTKKELDAIQPSPRTKRVPVENNNDEEEGDSVLC